MGWRYRKRVKILPGFHFNISKSGISTNIGIKCANVTFGKKGTSVNTGIPGTGVYRRDIIHRKKNNCEFDLPTKNNVSTNSNRFISNEYELHGKEAVVIPIFKTRYYLAYIVAMIMPFICLLLYANDWWMFFACLVTNSTQLVCLATLLITDHAKYPPQKAIEITKKLRYGHLTRFGLSCILVILNLFPLLAGGRWFLSIVNKISYSILHYMPFYNLETYEGGILVLAMTLIMIAIWLLAAYIEIEYIVRIRNFRSAYFREKENIADNILENTDTKPSLNVTVEKSKETKATIDNFWHIDEEYRYPSTSLLMSSPEENKDTTELEFHKEKLITILRSFGIEIFITGAYAGPRFNLFEVKPVNCYNFNKIESLEKDIALALCAQNVRITRPIWNEGIIDVEISSIMPHYVSIESVLSSQEFQNSQMALPCVVGKDVKGNVFMFDLKNAKNVLIAGSTGQGKSVIINDIITSLLYKKHPAELKFVMIDSGGAELGIYNQLTNIFLGIPHSISAIATEKHQVVSTLMALSREMDLRHGLLRKAQTYLIQKYNEKFICNQLSPKDGHKYLPYIVVIIDDYGVYMSEEGKQIETLITQLARSGYAVGINLILSTNITTSEVITESIKLNFQTRIAFHVPEERNSLTILDSKGAEQLLDKGDVLFLQKNHHPIRLQCALITTPEIEAINGYILDQQNNH